jgi:hypothetical protein
MIMDIDNRHLLPFAGMNRTAVIALAQLFVAIELLKQWREVADNTLQLHFGAMKELMATLAVPLIAVESALGPRHLDHDPNASSHALRRVPHVLGEEKNVPLFDWNLDRRLSGVSISRNEMFPFSW